MELNLPTLVSPLSRDPVNTELMELWKMVLKNYCKKLEDQEHNKAKVYALILGQCSPTTCDHIEASDERPATNTALAAIGLLQIIQQSLYHCTTRWKDTQALIDAELSLHCFKQTEYMSNPEFHEKLHELIEVYELTS